MANQEMTHLENGTVGYPVARTSNSDWSLRVYAAPDLTPTAVQATRLTTSAVSSTSLIPSIWRNLALASAVGLCGGFLIASFRVPNGGPTFATQPPTMSDPAPVVRRMEAPLPALRPGPVASPSIPFAAAATKKIGKHSAYLPPEEVARLKTRNRRLEALVEVLRNRKSQDTPLPTNSKSLKP